MHISPSIKKVNVLASQVALVVKNLPANAGDIKDAGLTPWNGKMEKEMATHSSILAWKSHGQRRQMDYNPWGHYESDMTERLTLCYYYLGN